MSKLIINFDSLADLSVPWPVGVDENDIVTSGLGPDDGARLIGFGPFGEQSAPILPEDARKDPSSVVGMSPSFSNAGGMFVWAVGISELSVIEPDHVMSQASVEAAEHQRRMREEV